MPRTPGQRIVAVLLSALGLVLIYRAATQSVVYDEAFTYLAFLSGPPSLVFTTYTANNHVLFSLLARGSIAAFGVSAFALRLPTVIAGFAYFATATALCRTALGAGRLFGLALPVLTLNPFVLDFLVAARGYGVALAFFLFAFYQFMLAGGGSDTPTARRWRIASVALALSVCANLTFLFPASALVLSAMALDVRLARHRGSFDGPHHVRCMIGALAPAVTIALVILAAPLRLATSAHFTYGTDTLEQTALSLVNASLRHGRDTWPADPDFVQPDTLGLVVLGGLIVPVLVYAGMLSVGTLLHPTRLGSTGPAGRLSVLAGGTTLLTLIELAGAHWTFGARYPYGRTGLYLVVLFLLTVVGVVWELQQSTTRRARVSSAAGLVVLAIFVGRFATELSTDYFYHWRYDAGTRDIVHIITARQRNTNRGPARVAAAQAFAQSLEFYRVTEGEGNLVIDAEHWLERPADFDYFVVSPETSRELRRTLPGLARVVYEHPTSGAVLMENLTPTMP